MGLKRLSTSMKLNFDEIKQIIEILTCMIQHMIITAAFHTQVVW